MILKAVKRAFGLNGEGCQQKQIVQSRERVEATLCGELEEAYEASRRSTYLLGEVLRKSRARERT